MNIYWFILFVFIVTPSIERFSRWFWYKVGLIKDADKELLKKADEIILDIHAQITTFSKYTASRVYEWKDLRGKSATSDLKAFDDNGRDE